jgi:hypothetical protein
MTTERFNVVLTGDVLRGHENTRVAAELAKLIKRDADFATKLLRGQPTKLRSGVDAATGTRYLEALERIGVAVRLEPETLEVDADLSAPLAITNNKGPTQATEDVVGATEPPKTPGRRFWYWVLMMMGLVSGAAALRHRPGESAFVSILAAQAAVLFLGCVVWAAVFVVRKTRALTARNHVGPTTTRQRRVAWVATVLVLAVAVIVLGSAWFAGFNEASTRPTSSALRSQNPYARTPTELSPAEPSQIADPITDPRAMIVGTWECVAATSGFKFLQRYYSDGTMSITFLPDHPPPDPHATMPSGWRIEVPNRLVSQYPDGTEFTTGEIRELSERTLITTSTRDGRSVLRCSR